MFWCPNPHHPQHFRSSCDPMNKHADLCETHRHTDIEWGWCCCCCSGNPSPTSSFCARRAAGWYLCALPQLSPSALVHQADTRKRVSWPTNPLPAVRLKPASGGTARQRLPGAAALTGRAGQRSPPNAWVREEITFFSAGEGFVLQWTQSNSSAVWTGGRREVFLLISICVAGWRSVM